MLSLLPRSALEVRGVGKCCGARVFQALNFQVVSTMLVLPQNPRFIGESSRVLRPPAHKRSSDLKVSPLSWKHYGNVDEFPVTFFYESRTPGNDLVDRLTPTISMPVLPFYDYEYERDNKHISGIHRKVLDLYDSSAITPVPENASYMRGERILAARVSAVTGDLPGIFPGRLDARPWYRLQWSCTWTTTKTIDSRLPVSAIRNRSALHLNYITCCLP